MEESITHPQCSCPKEEFPRRQHSAAYRSPPCRALDSSMIPNSKGDRCPRLAPVVELIEVPSSSSGRGLTAGCGGAGFAWGPSDHLGEAGRRGGSSLRLAEVDQDPCAERDRSTIAELRAHEVLNGEAGTDE